jgi:hypothetical protein
MLHFFAEGKVPDMVDIAQGMETTQVQTGLPEIMNQCALIAPGTPIASIASLPLVGWGMYKVRFSVASVCSQFRAPL